MPTENRSSNTEMVSVPRYSLEAARDCLVICQHQAYQSCECESCHQCGLMPDECTDTECSKTCQCTTCEHCMNKDSIDSLAALLAQPAEQHQGEPVALPARRDENQGDDFRRGSAHGFNACLVTIAKLGPLYTHADPNVRWKAVADEQMQVIDTLRAQLADLKQRHDGLHRDMATIAGREVPKGCTVADYAAAAIADALSASAEPSAPVERDERAAYDAWRRSESGYVRPFDRHEWSAWQARAALERKPS